MSKLRYLFITDTELEHLRTTLEGCSEELEELMRTEEWFVTELSDRIETCLAILVKAEHDER